MEIWMDVIGYEKYYQVSNRGGVRCFCDFSGGVLKTPRPLKPTLMSNGYLKVALKTTHINGGLRKEKLTHVLEAESFIPNPLKKKTVNHKDGDKQNNNLSNLEWNTHSENVKHAFRTGLRPYPDNNGERCPRAKISEYCAKNIMELYKYKMYSQNNLARIYGVSQPAISALLTGKNWSKTLVA